MVTMKTFTFVIILICLHLDVSSHVIDLVIHLVYVILQVQAITAAPKSKILVCIVVAVFIQIAVATQPPL